MTFGLVPPQPDFTTSGWSSSLREKTFFAVGVVILPPFWVWWTLRPGFTDKQRTAACVWTTVYLVALLATWPLMESCYLDAIYSSPLICGRVSLALALWFLVRLIGSWKILLFLLMSVDAIAILSSLAVPAFEKINAHSTWWHSLIGAGILLLFFAALHLALDPLRSAVGRFKVRTTPWLARHHLRWK